MTQTKTSKNQHFLSILTALAVSACGQLTGPSDNHLDPPVEPQILFEGSDAGADDEPQTKVWEEASIPFQFDLIEPSAPGHPWKRMIRHEDPNRTFGFATVDVWSDQEKQFQSIGYLNEAAQFIDQAIDQPRRYRIGGKWITPEFPAIQDRFLTKNLCVYPEVQAYRVIVAENVHLEGCDVKITSEILLMNASILGVEGTNPQKGISPGTLTIKARKIRGTATIVLNGARGATGASGAHGTSGQNGYYKSQKDHRVDGTRGLSGGNGAGGGVGGSGGTLRLTYQQMDLLALDAPGGPGGNGGPGGPGGPGGLGCSQGSNVCTKWESKYDAKARRPKLEKVNVRGNNGNHGPDGGPGLQGPPGSTGSIQVFQSDSSAFVPYLTGTVEAVTGLSF